MLPYEFNEYGFNDLHQATLGLKSISVEEVLEKSPWLIGEEDSDGRAALSWAAQRRDYEVVDLLLRSKANARKTDSKKWGPIFWALRGGSSRCARLLLKYGIDVNQVDCFGLTPLLTLAILPENTATVDLLLQQQPNIDFQGPAGDSALLGALQNRNFRIATKLIHHGANIHIKENSGYNALCVAVLYHAHPIIRLLLEREADHQGIIKQHGSFLHLVARTTDIETLRMLTNPGSGLATRNIQIRDSHGRTALTVAAFRVDMTLELQTAFRSFLWSVDTEKTRVSPVGASVSSNDAISIGDSDEEDNFVDALE